MKDVTAIVTTFNRAEALNKLIKSIRVYYPELPVIVVDNGIEESVIEDATYYKVPFDSGLSFCRNFAIQKVKTEYILLLDDDFEFTEKTKIEKLIKIAKKGFDFVGGNVENLDYHGLLELDNSVLRYIKGNRGKFENHYLYDMILNFFVARTDILKRYKWDDDLKLAEHTDFFLRLKGHAKITYVPSVIIKHNHERSEDYMKFRMRGKEFMQVFMRKHGIDCIVNFNGIETYLKGSVRERRLSRKNNDTKFVDFCITTFKRTNALKRLLFSIAKYYPMANVYVADQNEKLDREFYNDLRTQLAEAGLVKRLSVHYLGYDVGLSYARNFLMKNTPNKYKLILDDDFEFIDVTDIGVMVKLIEIEPSVAIVGGLVRQLGYDINFEFELKKIGTELVQVQDGGKYRNLDGIKYKKTGCVLNFALIRSEIFNYVEWDSNLKVNEHLDFFWRFNQCLPSYKILYTPNVVISHPPIPRTDGYKEMRTRPEFLVMMMRKHGLTKIRYLNGQVVEILPDNSIKRYREAYENK